MPSYFGGHLLNIPVYCHEGEFDSYLDIYRKATA